MNLQMSPAQMIAVVLTGMVVVFCVIVLLIILINLMGKIFTNIKNKKEVVQSKQPVTLSVNPESKADSVKDIPQTDDEEVIAVISAAIAMMSLSDGKNYRLKSVKAIKSNNSGRPAWSMAGLRENTRPFRQH